MILARAAIDGLLQSPNPRVRELAYLHRVLSDCVVSGDATANDLHQAIALARPEGHPR
ncbi:MAG: hypothetical protein IPH43_11410 [Xanthomonadales bacterium]|nr:hypothetical protein [Xanthomonadales bacterium]